MVDTEIIPFSRSAKVFVRGLTVQAEIGLYPHEQGRTQPLVVDAELTITPPSVDWDTIGRTVNYERVREHALKIIATGHIGLVESFAWRLARACLTDRRVLAVRINVEKPEALAPHARAAGVEITMERARPTQDSTALT